MALPPDDPDGSSFAAHLDRWVAEARIDEAALGRARERWLREVAEQEASLAGVLTDLAERSAPVTIQVLGGRRHHGAIGGVGADFVAVGHGSGGDVLLSVSAITAVRTGPDLGATLGDRTLGTDLLLSDVLAELAADREPVVIATRDGERVAGVLRSAGRDLVVLRTETERPTTVYLPMAAITEVLIG